MQHQPVRCLQQTATTPVHAAPSWHRRENELRPAHTPVSSTNQTWRADAGHHHTGMDMAYCQQSLREFELLHGEDGDHLERWLAAGYYSWSLSVTWQSRVFNLQLGLLDILFDRTDHVRFLRVQRNLIFENCCAVSFLINQDPIFNQIFLSGYWF